MAPWVTLAAGPLLTGVPRVVEPARRVVRPRVALSLRPRDALLLMGLVLLVVAVGGKLLGVGLAARVLGWQRGEASLVGWLLQTKALIMIIFANVLLDRGVISADTFTALLLMAVASTMLTVPMVAPRLDRLRAVVAKSA